MKKRMALKRILLELIQHPVAAAIMLAVAFIMFHSYVGIESMSEFQNYYIDFASRDPVFEETAVYDKIVAMQTEDIIRFVSLRMIMEENGVFDPGKVIDVTQLANQGEPEANCAVTAKYYLEDLIKWGKNGAEYHDRVMSVTDFVNYFGTVLKPEYFSFDEFGNLIFLGFVSSAEKEAPFYPYGDDPDSQTNPEYEELFAIQKEMLKYSTKELEEMVFSYIMTENLDEISIQEEEDGSYSVRLSLLRSKYETTDHSRSLISYADNWIDYFYLQRNLVYSAQLVSQGYEYYQNGLKLYGEKKGNFFYMIRIQDDEGIIRDYTNLANLESLDEDDITEYISEYRRYLIYYLDELAFYGITDITETDMYRFMKNSFYPFPENVRIWMAVDTAYPVEGDALYRTYQAFERIVPNLPAIIGGIMALMLVWIGIFIYLSSVTGVKRGTDGKTVYYSVFIDKIWTEMVLFLLGMFGYGIYRIKIELTTLVDVSNELALQLSGRSNSNFYEYMIFALWGLCVSILADILGFSVIRRIRCGLLWKNSLLKKLTDTFSGIYYFISRHTNSTINTLLPYNVFLLVNIIGVIYTYDSFTNGRRKVAVLVGAMVVMIDGIVGVRLFRGNAEKNDIVEGINRIRSGDVDYKLDIRRLSGINKDLADAVNNIGEGIRNAVNTSMKDEQMKTDLITNVSHDLKTPLTSIINYVDLLKRSQLKDEKTQNYIEVLDVKAQRLKQLTDDLVEASKISSGNITLNMEKIDPEELMRQTLGEFSEKLEEKGLSVVFESEKQRMWILADSRRMWRVIDNLFNNIYKYAFENTRIYIEIHRVQNDVVEIGIKNVAAKQIRLRGEELAERFIRGDESRTGEGSGLGLFIAKSLTQAQGGSFEIMVDGDLFKVVMKFPAYQENAPI